MDQEKCFTKALDFENIDDDLSESSTGGISAIDDDDISYISDQCDFFGDTNQSIDGSTKPEDLGAIPNQYFVNKKDIVSSSIHIDETIRRSLLNDPTFAPPPEVPNNIENSRILAKDAPPNASTLPNWNDITHSGSILARISARSKIMKKWKECFWITYGESKVLLFRSKSDFDEWVSNPYLSDIERNFLVKLRIDFVLDYNNDIYMLGYQVTKQKTKYYKNESEVLHQFQLKKKMDDNMITVAAFSSIDESEVTSLRIVFSELAKKHQSSRPTTIKRSQKA